MKKCIILSTLIVAIVFVVTWSAWAQQTRRSNRGLYGDWNVKINFDQRQMESILNFSRNREGDQTGQWISFWGVSELKDITYEAEADKLSFRHERPNRQGQTTISKFTGTIKEGKLTGTISSDRGEYKLEGQRAPRLPRPVGIWEMKYKMGEREFTAKLVVKADKTRQLSAEWQSERGEHEVTDVKYEQRKLTFKRKSKFQDRQFESTFEGTINREGALTGTIKSEQRDITATGKRFGSEMIGTWNLELVPEDTSDQSQAQRVRKQRLRVNPDMSGLYGSIPVEEIKLGDGKVSFKIVMEFGERKFEMNFNGKLAEGKLLGKLVTSRGTQKVTGTKVVRRAGRRSTRSGRRSTR